MVQQTSSAERPPGVRMAYAIADAVMHIHRERVGRGPTKAQAFFRRNVVVVVMEDTMTRGEKNLVANGQVEDARTARASFSEMMRGDLVAAVEELTGAAVVAFLSDSSAEPDVAVQVYVLDRQVPGDANPSDGRDGHVSGADGPAGAAPAAANSAGESHADTDGRSSASKDDDST